MARYRHDRNQGAAKQCVVTTSCLNFAHAFRKPLLICVMGLVAGCMNTPNKNDPAAGLGYKEIARVRSSDNKLEAVLVEFNGGATTPFSYHLFIVGRGGTPSGEAVVRLSRVIPITGQQLPTVRWASDSKVLISISKGEVFNSSNMTYGQDGRRIGVVVVFADPLDQLPQEGEA